MRGGLRYGFEFKFSDAPSTTKSIRVAMNDLKLERLWIVYPGNRNFALDDRIEAAALTGLASSIAKL